MSEATTILVSEKDPVTAARAKVTIVDIFLEFLIIGATRFGGVVPDLREGLITKNHRVDDKEFVELLSIRQSLPGLNATNMAVLLGDQLKGWLGALSGIVGVCLPGAAIMFAMGIVYRIHGDHAIVTALLKGAATAAAGMLLATVIQLGKKSLSHRYDLIFVFATVLAVNRLHLGVPKTFVIVGLVAILSHYSGHGLDDRRHRIERAADYVMAQNKSGTACGWGSPWWAASYSCLSEWRCGPQSSGSGWSFVRADPLMFSD